MEALNPVKILSTVLVNPAQCSDHLPKLKLTGFDNIFGAVPYQQRILFYKAAPDNRAQEEALQLLKKSLAEVLVVFYPLTGRITTDEDGSPIIDCGLGQSVRFIHSSTDSTLEQLGEFQPSEFCDSLCDMDSGIPKYPWTLEDPLLLIQVTTFKCGGLSVGIAFNHQVMDGTAAWHFMNSWADVARVGEVLAPPEITYSFKAPDLTPEQFEENKRRLGFHLPISGITPVTKLVTKVYHLGPEMIQRLKTDAAAATNGTKPSTFVVVGAYFWRRVTLARQLSGSDETRFIVNVNCRERVPSMPKRHFGNGATAFTVKLQAEQIQHSDHWLPSCATIIHEGIRSCSAGSLAESVAYFLWVASNPEEMKDLNFWHNVVHPIGSHNHPVYKTEFGFGKPIGVTIGRGDLGDGKLYLFPSAKGDGGVTTILVLPPDVMNRLAEQDVVLE